MVLSFLDRVRDRPAAQLLSGRRMRIGLVGQQPETGVCRPPGTAAGAGPAAAPTGVVPGLAGIRSTATGRPATDRSRGKPPRPANSCDSIVSPVSGLQVA